MNENVPTPNDPWGYLPDLKAACGHPALVGCEVPDFVPGPDFPAAAYELAVAMSFVRVYGVDPNVPDGALPPILAVAVADRLLARLAAARKRLEALGDEWDAAEDEIVGDALIYEILDTDLEAWAVLEVLIETDEDAYEAVATAEAVEAVSKALSAYTAWQDALQAEIGLLSTVAGTSYIVNIRETLAPQYRETAPWWLGPDLDEAAAEERRQALATLPRIPPRPDRQAPVQVSEPAMTWADTLPAQVEPTAVHAAVMDSGIAILWKSPDDRFTALLDIPDRPAAGDACEVRLCFRTAADPYGPPLELVGRAIDLSGLTAVPDAEGTARFRLGDLRALGARPIELRLVGDPRFWHVSR